MHGQSRALYAPSKTRYHRSPANESPEQGRKISQATGDDDIFFNLTRKKLTQFFCLHFTGEGKITT